MSTGTQFVAMANAFGVMTEAQWPYRVTFSRATESTGSDGGATIGSSSASEPTGIPCRYRPANGREIQLAGKTVPGVLYSIFIPNSYSDSLVDVTSESTGTIAATTGGEPARSFSVVAPLREMGLQVAVLAAMGS